MGRHGGGSSGGGSRGGGGRGGRSGSSVRSGSSPFRGGYNRSFYHRGRFYSHYTSDRDFGRKSGWTAANVLSLLFVTIHMCLMLGAVVGVTIHLGSKVDGDISRIKIVDEIDVLTRQEEDDVMLLLWEVYERSGMPVTVHTDDFEWTSRYDNIEVYSESLYYRMGLEEDAMIFLFCQETVGGYPRWEYDFYCGDDTVACLSDDSFYELVNNFQKAMNLGNTAYALEFAWTSVMDDLASLQINFTLLPIVCMLVFFYSVFFVVLFGKISKANRAKKYFDEHPWELDEQPLDFHPD